MKNYKSYFSLNRVSLKILLFTLTIITYSCSKKNYSSLPEYQFVSINKIPDYSNLNYWAAHPWKKDLSDSIPKPLRKNFVKDSLVDVFFIHPTTLTTKEDNRWNAPIDDATINAKTDYSSILYQASVFNEQCRVFAPRYRQAHYKAFFIAEREAAPYFEIAYQDVKNAFEYYLKNYNGGRPIIIASHSQGTKHAARLLKEFFDGKDLQNKLVCAYIIGLPIPVNYFTSIPVSTNANSTGCVISWRTYKTGFIDQKFVAKENYKAVVVNPLTWTTDSLFVNKKNNKGGVLLKFNKIVPHVVNAQIHNNVLWTSKPDVFGKLFFTKKNFHAGDINLFYMNIRQNVRNRIKVHFMNKKNS